MLTYADRDLLSALRAGFLHKAQEDVIRLRDALSAGGGGAVASAVDDWIGGAALLGFPEIGQKSLEVHSLLQRTGSSDALQPKITEVDRACLRAQSRALLGASEVPSHIASSLDGKKLALVGFAAAEASSLAAEYKRLGAHARAFVDGRAAVAAKGFQEIELVVLCLRPDSDLLFWKKSRMARRKAFLVLESGGVALPAVTDLPGAAGDILWEPWDARTLLLRSLWLVASHAAQEAAAGRPTLAAKCRTAARWLTGRAFVLAAWGGFVGFAVYVFTKTPLAELLQGLAWLESVIRWYLAILLAWMIYNVLLYRWKGPRIMAHLAAADWTSDQLGRAIVLTRGTSLQDAHLVVDVQDGKKVYSAFFPATLKRTRPTMMPQLLEWISVIEQSQAYWIAVQFYGLYPIVTSLIWIITALIYYYHRDRRAEPHHPDATPEAELPFVSILIPAYCEQASIGRSLEGLVSIDYPNYEVIVINDGSPDGTAEEVKPFLSDPRVRFIDKRVNEGKAMALNDAIPCARGELLLVMDADSIPAPSLIRNLVPHFRDPNVGAVAGNPRVRNRRNLLAKLQAVEFSSVIGLMRRAQRVWGQVMCVPGVCGLFRKSAIVQAGMFSPGMATEDIDLTWKLQMDGYDVRYEARAMVWMEVPESVKVLWKQRTRWALGLGQVLRRHVRVLWTRKFIRLYPIFVESFLSVVWAWIFVSLTTFWLLCFALSHNPLGGSLIPNYWGLLLFLCCLLQLSCGVWVDSKYDPDLPPELYVSVFYPSFYWMLMATSSCFYTTKGMLRRLDLKSPTRWRIQRSQDAAA